MPRNNLDMSSLNKIFNHHCTASRQVPGSGTELFQAANVAPRLIEGGGGQQELEHQAVGAAEIWRGCDADCGCCCWGESAEGVGWEAGGPGGRLRQCSQVACAPTGRYTAWPPHRGRPWLTSGTAGIPASPFPRPASAAAAKVCITATADYGGHSAAESPLHDIPVPAALCLLQPASVRHSPPGQVQFLVQELGGELCGDYQLFYLCKDDRSASVLWGIHNTFCAPHCFGFTTVTRLHGINSSFHRCLC